MGKCTSTIKEIRFDVEDPEITHVYVINKAEGDCPIGLAGCHHKAFPGSTPVKDILAEGHILNFLEWGLEVPPEETSEKERADRLEAMIDRMAGKLSDCTLLVLPMRELCLQIENCGGSEELTKASTMACDILHKLMDALEMKTLPPGAR